MDAQSVLQGFAPRPWLVGMVTTHRARATINQATEGTASASLFSFDSHQQLTVLQLQPKLAVFERT